MAFIAGIDIGGTQTRCAIAKKDHPLQICSRIAIPTPQDGPDPVLDAITELLLGQLKPEDTLLSVGCVAPGMVDFQNGSILRAANLNGWVDIPLRNMLESKIGVPAIVENDVNAASIAEARFTTDSTSSPIVYMTVSTGIAAGILIDNKILRGANFCAGEIGGMIPSPKFLGKSWQPGGCTERHASGIGLATQWAQIRGGSLSSSRAIEVFEAADEGDVEAENLIATAVNYITQAAVGIACVIDPAIIILGGGIGQAKPEIVQHIRQELENSVPYPPTVELSRLEDDAPLLGSLLLADSLADSLSGSLSDSLTDSPTGFPSGSKFGSNLPS